MSLFLPFFEIILFVIPLLLSANCHAPNAVKATIQAPILKPRDWLEPQIFPKVLIRNVLTFTWIEIEVEVEVEIEVEIEKVNTQGNEIKNNL